MDAITNYFRRKHARVFMRATGVLGTDRDGLQRLVENGSLLRKHNLNTSQNLNRYHRAAPQLLGTNVPAANPIVNVDHYRVEQIPENQGVVPRSDLASMLKKYISGGFREFFFHKDKQREVAKGIADIYKEYQRIQATERRRLTVQEAAAIIDQRKYTAARSALEQLVIDLEYVGTTRPNHLAPNPYGAANVLVTPTADKIHSASQVKGLAKLPDWVHGLAQEGIPLAIATLNPLGFLAGYGIFKGAQLISGAVSNYISNRVRTAGATYAKTEEGWENEAQLASRLTSLGTFGTVMTATTGAFGFGLTTGIIAGSAVANYVASKRRQVARSGRHALENSIQQGNNNLNLENTINDCVESAVFYEKVSRGLDLLAFASMGAGLAYGFYNQAAQSSTPAPEQEPTTPAAGSTTTSANGTTSSSGSNLISHGEWKDAETHVKASYDFSHDKNWYGTHQVLVDRNDHTQMQVNLNDTLAKNAEYVRLLIDSNHNGKIGAGDSSVFAKIENGKAFFDTNYDLTSTRFHIGAVDVDQAHTSINNGVADISLQYLSSVDSKQLNIETGFLNGHHIVHPHGAAIATSGTAGAGAAQLASLTQPLTTAANDYLHFDTFINRHQADAIDHSTHYDLVGKSMWPHHFNSAYAVFDEHAQQDYKDAVLYLDADLMNGTHYQRQLHLDDDGKLWFNPYAPDHHLRPGAYTLTFEGDKDGDWINTRNDVTIEQIVLDYYINKTMQQPGKYQLIVE